jgi:acetylornithine/succinyldiaminopimelate/putrescine aminotransferase
VGVFEDNLRQAFLHHVCQTSPEPLGIVVARARGSKIWDVGGREYLDLLAGMGVANIGHAHPAVVAAVEKQLASYLHVSVYGEMIQQPQVELARRLAEVTPGGAESSLRAEMVDSPQRAPFETPPEEGGSSGRAEGSALDSITIPLGLRRPRPSRGRLEARPPSLSVVYFTNSGTEAVEGALKTARKHTGRSRFIAFAGAFHGDTLGSLSVGGNPVYQEPFRPLLANVKLLPFDSMATLQRIDTSVAAVIVEPVQAEGGVRIPGEEFLPALRQRCTEVGALLIADEVITGFGRTGKLFACEHWNVVPDILVLAKALGGGMPLGAFVGRPEVMQTLSRDPPLAHVTTFGGHPVSCAAGLAALECLLAERLAERATRVGAEWLEELQAIKRRVPCTARGKGLLMALEFETPVATRRFVTRCFERGLILNWTLHRDTVVRLAPPLTISSDEIKHANAMIAAALDGT